MHAVLFGFVPNDPKFLSQLGGFDDHVPGFNGLSIPEGDYMGAFIQHFNVSYQDS